MSHTPAAWGAHVFTGFGNLVYKFERVLKELTLCAREYVSYTFHATVECVASASLALIADNTLDTVVRKEIAYEIICAGRKFFAAFHAFSVCAYASLAITTGGAFDTVVCNGIAYEANRALRVVFALDACVAPKVTK